MTLEEGGGIMFEVLVTLGVTVVGTAIGGIISGVITYYIIKRFF